MFCLHLIQEQRYKVEKMQQISQIRLLSMVLSIFTTLGFFLCASAVLAADRRGGALVMLIYKPELFIPHNYTSVHLVRSLMDRQSCPSNYGKCNGRNGCCPLGGWTCCPGWLFQRLVFVSMLMRVICGCTDSGCCEPKQVYIFAFLLASVNRSTVRTVTRWVVCQVVVRKARFVSWNIRFGD